MSDSLRPGDDDQPDVAGRLDHTPDTSMGCARLFLFLLFPIN